MKLFGIKSVENGPLLGADDLRLPRGGGLRRCITAMSGLTFSAVSTFALGLGLGEMQAKSYLGQPLNAQVELVSLDGDIDINTLIVRQVPAAEAEAMGVDIPYTRYSLELKVDTSSGVPVVTIASGQAINEPYLNLLIELRWPAGVLYREYPVLLDPAPLVDVARVNVQSKSKRLGEAKSAQPLRRSGAQPAPVQMELSPLHTVNGKYQVQTGDSLSKIAERWREGTSQGIDETMQWLYENNPKAFARGDIDQLMAGAVLTMPDLSALTVADKAVIQPRARSANQASNRERNEVELSAVTDQQRRASQSRVGQDAALSESAGGLLTLGAATRDDKTRELIDLLVRENESLKERVEKLENSVYLDTLKELIVLQRQQITDLRSELGVADSAIAEEMDSLFARVGIDPTAVRSTAEVADEREAIGVASESAAENKQKALVELESSVKPVTQLQEAEHERNWFIAFVIGAGVLLVGLFWAMYVYYRKLVPVKSVEEEYKEILGPVDEDENEAQASYDLDVLNEPGEFILYDGAPQSEYDPKSGAHGDDWMGERADPSQMSDAELIAAIDDVQKSFEDISLDQDMSDRFDDITETSLEAITKEMPRELPVDVAQEPLQTKDETRNREKQEAKEGVGRRPDEEVKMSIAEKMSQYNPDEYRQELENLGFLELDELVDLNGEDEDEVEAVIYRAMMFCEFKKFDKGADLLESKMELVTDQRLNDALEQVYALRASCTANKKVS